MQKLFYFFYKYRAFLFFILLEIICFTFIIKHNSYQSSLFFTSSNSMVGEVLNFNNSITSYFSLKAVNQDLSSENAILRSQLEIEKNKNRNYVPNGSDSARINQLKFYPAKVINNSTSRFANYLTLNKGFLDGVKPGMGVISNMGVVGRVKNCSDHFSTVISLLHEKFNVSAKIKKGNIDGFVKWDGKSPRKAILHFVARHHTLHVNDSVVTSGYNSLFPEGVMIGKINKFEIDQGQPFYKIEIDLSTDFTNLAYVYIIENNLKAEIDSLEFPTKSLDSEQ